MQLRFFFLTPLRAGIRLPAHFIGRFLFERLVISLQRFHFKFRIAKRTFHLLQRRVECNRAAAAGAFIFQKLRHKLPPKSLVEIKKGVQPKKPRLPPKKYYTRSFSSKGSPHCGQNFGASDGSCGVQPHLLQRYLAGASGFFAPQF